MMLCRRLKRPLASTLHNARRPLFSSLWDTPDEVRRKQYEDLTMEEVREINEMEQQRERELEKELLTRQPWKVLLQPAARAGWRVSDYQPPHLIERRNKLVKATLRTHKQLKRAQKGVREAQQALALRRERERKKARGFNRAKSGSIEEQKENEKDAGAQSIYYTSETTCATLQSRFLPNYAISKRVLLETQALLPHYNPKRVLDFGIGVGSSSVAASEVFSDLEWIHGVDPSTSMRECAEKVLEGCGPARVTTDTTVSNKKSGAGTFDLILFTYTASELPHAVATLAAAAVLWEKLAPNGVFVMIEPGTPDGFNSIRSVRSMLLDCCPPDPPPKVEVVDDEEDLEHEDGEEYHDPNAVYDECHIIAPCTHNSTCPMERHRRKIHKADVMDDADNVEDDDDDDVEEAEFQEDEEFPGANLTVGMDETDAFETGFCSFVHTIPGISGVSQHFDKKGDKLSYLVAQKRYPDIDSQPDASYPFANLHIADILAETYRVSDDRDPIQHEIMAYETDQAKEKFMSLSEEEDPLGLSVLAGDANRKSFGRIVRAPLKKKGHIIVDYCAAARTGEKEGRIVRHLVGKARSTRVAPGSYTAARKSRWGGLWPDTLGKLGRPRDESKIP